MSRYNFKLFEPNDAAYEAICAIGNAVYVDAKSDPEYYKHRDRMTKDKYFERYVCEVDGRIVAVGVHGEAWWAVEPGKYFIFVIVHPDYQNRGIGSALYALNEQKVMQREGLRAIQSDTREDFAHGIRFLEKRGYKQVMRYPRSKLDVQAFQPEKYTDLLERLSNDGIEIISLNQLAERYDDYQRRVYDAEVSFLKDVPSPEPFKPMPFEQYLEQQLGHPAHQPESYFVALDGDAVVGVSMLGKTPDAERLGTGLTGVARSHRRRGLATALKATALGFAKSKGIVEVDTDNEENNPMYQLNLQLGFKPAPAHLDYMKYIEK